MTRKELCQCHSCAEYGCRPKANSGHPGAPMGMADIAEVLWNDFLRHNPTDPTGTIVTGLFCPTATPQCCFTACCIFPVTTCRSKN